MAYQRFIFLQGDVAALPPELAAWVNAHGRPVANMPGCVEVDAVEWVPVALAHKRPVPRFVLREVARRPEITNDPAALAAILAQFRGCRGCGDGIDGF